MAEKPEEKARAGIDQLLAKAGWAVQSVAEDFDYDPNQLDRDVVAVDQIRTIVRTFRDRLRTEIFRGRTEVPKTLVFAKDDSHAEDIVHILREEFSKGNECARAEVCCNKTDSEARQ